MRASPSSAPGNARTRGWIHDNQRDAAGEQRAARDEEPDGDPARTLDRGGALVIRDHAIVVTGRRRAVSETSVFGLPVVVPALIPEVVGERPAAHHGAGAGKRVAECAVRSAFGRIGTFWRRILGENTGRRRVRSRIRSRLWRGPLGGN